VSHGAAVALTPKQLLQHAYGLLEDPPAVFASRWPRAVALLARQALEASLEELWAKRDVKIGWATERTQLLFLPEVMGDRRLAVDAAVAWSGLSRACHQHPYDLSPTSGELAGWLETVDELGRAVDGVERATAEPAAGRSLPSPP
jgi:hypothetical protein